MSATERSPNLALVVVAMTVGNAIILISQTAAPLALPSVMSEFSVGSATVQWVLSASLLPLAGFLVLGGRLADLFGRRRVFVVGASVFAAASLAAGVAPTFELLIVFRALQGIGGALLLPTSVAIVSAVAGSDAAGRALGLLGGAAAVGGAFGPIIGGTLTSSFSWRAVMLVNVPLAVLAVLTTLVVVPRDPARATRPNVDLRGSILLCATLIGVVFGLAQSQSWGWTSPGVYLPLVLAVVTGAAFVVVERRSRNPLMNLSLFRKHRNYAGAVVSQGLGGLLEMGLGVIFPFVLILGLGLDPAAAGLALLPATLPMVVVAPLAGRWYDKVGGRIPLVVGFALLAVSGVALAIGVWDRSLLALMPGLLLYGVGLAIVLTVNDPVSLDSVPQKSHGQASGVSATAEQFGGAIGIALLYLFFHSSYVSHLHRLIDTSPTLADLSNAEYAQLRNDVIAAEETGLHPTTFAREFRDYLDVLFEAAAFGFSIAFAFAAVAALVGALSSARLVRRVKGSPPKVDDAESVFATGATASGGDAGRVSDPRRSQGDQSAPDDAREDP